MRFFLALLLIATLWSCEVTSVKNVPLPASSEKLAVIGLATNLGLGVYVSTTASFQGSSVATGLLAARVSLLRDNQMVELLQKQSLFYTTSQRSRYGPDYLLQVQHATLGEASVALESLPERVAIVAPSATFDKNERDVNVSFSLKDAGAKNYYGYKIVPTNSRFSAPDSLFYRLSPNQLFDNLAFANQTKTVQIRQQVAWRSATGQTIRANRVTIYLYHLSPATYDYYRSLGEYLSFFDDTFAIVSPVKNNIKNGHGFVGVCNIDSVSVVIRP